MRNYKLDAKDIVRFISKIDTSNECWIPKLKKNKSGYCIFTVKRTNEYLAHRLSYSFFVEDLIDGMVIDHICKNRACCNPTHLRQVTQYFNVVENSVSKIALQKIKTHCDNGHPLSGTNLRLEKRSMGRSGFCRRCITCANKRQRERYKKNGSDKESPEIS